MKPQVDSLAREHWCELEGLVGRWLKERQELIMLMCAITGLREYAPKDTPVSVRIQAFCQVLMDYVSAGHFEVYEKLMREMDEFNGPPVSDEEIQVIYSRIEASTELAVLFNDKFDTPAHCDQLMAALPRDLSVLGERLSERFELEDQLIDDLHNSHRALLGDDPGRADVTVSAN